jgi:alkylhydroperoxidase family enzyme
MAFIATVPPRHARGETAEVYRYMGEVAGGGDLVAKIVQLFSLRPASMRRMIRSWELAMWVGSEPRATRELVAATISRLNDCHY